MKHLILFIIGFLYAFFAVLLISHADAQTLNVLRPSQGGTGISSTTAGHIGDCLKVSTAIPLAYLFDTCGSGGGSFPFTVTNYGVATGTTVGFTSGLLSTASSTLNASTTITGALTLTGGTTTASGGLNLTGGGLKIGNLSGVLKASSGAVIVDPNTYLTAAITALGPNNQTNNGPTIVLATSTSASNGLTSALTIVGSGGTMTFTPSLSGTLNTAGLAGTRTLGNLWYDGTNIVSTTSVFTVGSLIGTTTATSTLAGGLNVTSGCFSINNVCVSSGSGVTGGTAGMLAAFTSATALTATGTPTFASFVSTSTATSTMAGGIQVNGGGGLSSSVGLTVTGGTVLSSVPLNITSASQSNFTSSVNTSATYLVKNYTALSHNSNDTQLLVGNTGSSLDIGFYTDSLTRMLIASSTGNVGIATSSPYAKLSVAGNVVAANYTATTSTSTFAGLNLTSGGLTIGTITSVQCLHTDTSGNVTGTGSDCGSGGVSGGTAGMLAAWTGASSLTATGTPTFAAFTATSTTGTSTIANAVKITANSQTGSSNQGISEGTLNINNTNSNYYGLQVYSGNNSPSAALATIVTDSTSFTQPMLYIQDSSHNAASTGLRIDHWGFPAVAFVDTSLNNSIGDGKYQFASHNDLFRIEGRDSANSSFDPIANFGRGDGSTTARIGFYTGFGVGTARLELVGTSTTAGMPYFGIDSAKQGVNALDIFAIDSMGRVGVASATPGAQFAINGTSTPKTALFLAATSTGNATNTAFIIDKNGLVGIGTNTPSTNFQLDVNGLAYFSGTGTSTVANGLNVGTLNVTSSSASSTFANGINLTAGCFAVNNTCLSTGGSTNAAGGTGAVQFANGTAFAGDTTNLFWDNTAKRLGIGTGTPASRLSVTGDVFFDSTNINIGSSSASTTLNYLGGATTTIRNNMTNVFSFATSTTATPLFSLSTAAGSNTGYFGVGTSTPKEELTVNGGLGIWEGTGLANCMRITVGGTVAFKVDCTAANPSMNIGTTTAPWDTNAARLTVVKTPAGTGAAATTTINLGAVGTTTSRVCFNIKTASGNDASFYVNAGGTAMVVENHSCN